MDYVSDNRDNCARNCPSLELKKKFGIKVEDTFARKSPCQHELASATCWKKGVGDHCIVEAWVSESQEPQRVLNPRRAIIPPILSLANIIPFWSQSHHESC